MIRPGGNAYENNRTIYDLKDDYQNIPEETTMQVPVGSTFPDLYDKEQVILQKLFYPQHYIIIKNQ